MKRAIGIFDSGVGGLTVVREVFKHLPNENLIYFGDIARMPYGSKTPEEILEIVREIIDWMKSFNVKAIAMACNTSSALALDTVQKEYDLPIFGLINPAASYIKGLGTDVKRVGIIATAATVKSGAYSRAIKNLRPDIDVFEMGCPGLVEIVESGQTASKSAYKEVRKYVEPLLNEKVDKIILGCTHYPYLSEVINDVAGRKNLLINPAEFMVMEMKTRLDKIGLINELRRNSVREFYVSAGPIQFIKVGNRLLPGVLNPTNVKLQAAEAGRALAV